jgi:chemotaxis protein methyltransferase CheR
MHKPTLPERNEREFRLTPQEFDRIRRLIYEHAGIVLGDTKREMVYSRLARRLRATGCNNFSEYLGLLEKANRSELESFTNSLTTNLTAFFREPHHFQVLASHLKQHCSDRPATLWCSAASTGEEAYTMAMTAADALGPQALQVTIIATDLDTAVLDVARSALYPESRLAKLPADIVRRHFERDSGCPSGFVRVKSYLRNRVTFRQLNLVQPNWPIRGPLDAIFCRNVMIYFDREMQLSLLKRFAPLLRNTGLLFVGHSESFYQTSEQFKLRGKTVYELA